MSLFQNLRRDAQMLSLIGISPYHLARFIGTQTCLRRQAQFFFPVSFHSMSLEHSCSFQESCFNGRSMKTQILAPLPLWTPPKNLSPVPGYKRKGRFSCVSDGIREKKLFFSKPPLGLISLPWGEKKKVLGSFRETHAENPERFQFASSAFSRGLPMSEEQNGISSQGATHLLWICLIPSVRATSGKWWCMRRRSPGERISARFPV